MTLQQLEYIVSLDKYRNFVKAAEASHVTQSTLSAMIQKLETELDVLIFDRTQHPILPTNVGERIINQAKIVLWNASQVKEIVVDEKKQDSGFLKIGLIATVAPYLLPQLFQEIRLHYPNITLNVTESLTDVLIQKLILGEIDLTVMATPLKNDNLLEIPIYKEKFVAYISPYEDLYHLSEIEPSKIPTEHLWILKEGHCFRNQVLAICDKKSGYSAIYESGSIDTLVKIVDMNGGLTIIPEMHIPFLSESQKGNIRPLVKPEPSREISIVVRKDFVKERLINIIADNLKAIIPKAMINQRLLKYRIKL